MASTYANDVRPRAAVRAILLPGLLFILGNAWAAQYISAKMIGDAGIDPVSALMNVHILLVAAFGSWLAASRTFFRPTGRQAVFFFAVAAVGSVISILAELAAAPHIPASLLTIIIAMAPVFTLAFTLALGSERLTKRTFAAIAMGLAASLVILVPGTQTSGSLFWIAVAFIAPAGFGAMGVIMSAWWPAGLDPLQVAFGLAVAGLAMLIPMSGFSGPALMISGGWGASDLALLCFGLSFVVEFSIFAILTRLGGAVYASCADFVATGMGLFWAWLIFAEVPTAWMWIAAFLSVATLFIVKSADSRTMLADESRSAEPRAADM
jgi:drug/metabolite transporter (DMT)-like permease